MEIALALRNVIVRKKQDTTKTNSPKTSSNTKPANKYIGHIVITYTKA